jgi:hypothetical protein
VLALREYLCGTQSDTSRYEVLTKSKSVYMLVVLRDLSNCYQKFPRTIIDYGEYSATCSDIYESFADGRCLLELAISRKEANRGEQCRQ